MIKVKKECFYIKKYIKLKISVHFYISGYTFYGDKMEYIEMIILPIISMIVLFIFTKLMGYRQITQLSLYDYIIGITIGSIASELAVSSFDNYLQSLIAMIIFGLGTCLLSVLTRISKKTRTLIEGNPIVLYENDHLNCKALKIGKIDIDEFLMTCRVNGYFNLNDLEKVILETNGRFSFYPKENARPVQYIDLDKQLNHETMPIDLIKEGKILKSNLKYIHKDEKWLNNQIIVKGLLLKDIQLMYQDTKGNLYYYLNNEKKNYFI